MKNVISGAIMFAVDLLTRKKMISDSLATNAIQCPVELLGTFHMGLNNGSESVCSADKNITPELSVCGDRSRLIFNNTGCASQKGYSGV